MGDCGPGLISTARSPGIAHVILFDFVLRKYSIKNEDEHDDEDYCQERNWMTQLMVDISRQPEELSRLIAHAFGNGKDTYEHAMRLIEEADHLYITGIGSSWHAGMAIQTVLHSGGRPACLLDASEFLHFNTLAAHSVVIVLSRSGKSIEIVNLLAKAKDAGAKIISITNTPDSPLAENADVVFNLGAPFDHCVSALMYSGLALVGGLLASYTLDNLNGSLGRSLQESVLAVKEYLPSWVQQIGSSTWFDDTAPYYFLARGASLASCHEARLVWEEAVKLPATAMTTSGFRHGPQEVIVEGFRFGLWIDSQRMRDQDLALAADIRKLGGKLLVIGQDLSRNDGDLVLSLPNIEPGWQFLIDIIPAQLAGEYFSRLRGVDCDSFRICSYIVESEGGLLESQAPGRHSLPGILPHG